MLHTTTKIQGLRLSARDGDFGGCKDLLFDARRWTVRYVVADTGSWISGRQVLVSPISIGDVDETDGGLSIDLTRDQIERSPPLSADAPVSRQHEISFNRYYGYPHYWLGPTGAWGLMSTPVDLRRSSPSTALDDQSVDGDPNLRSVGEVTGYAVSAKDGEIGHVEDFLLDGHTWTLRYMIIDTRNWLLGRKVLVAPGWVMNLYWASRAAELDLTRAEIEASPRYESAKFDRQYEVYLHDALGRPAYWDVRGP